MFANSRMNLRDASACPRRMQPPAPAWLARRAAVRNAWFSTNSHPPLSHQPSPPTAIFGGVLPDAQLSEMEHAEAEHVAQFVAITGAA